MVVDAHDSVQPPYIDTLFHRLLREGGIEISYLAWCAWGFRDINPSVLHGLYLALRHAAGGGCGRYDGLTSCQSCCCLT